MSNDRRAFFKKAAGAAVGLAAVDTFLGASGRAAGPEGVAGAVAPKGTGASRFALVLEGNTVGVLKSFEGGDVSAEVIEGEKDSCGATKHIGPPIYAPIALEWGTGMGGDFYDWVSSFMSCKAEGPVSGAITAADLNLKEVWRIAFQDALITEVGFPSLDATSKDASSMTLKFAPTKTERQEGSGVSLKSCGTGKKVATTFRLTIDGLDCSKVSKIGAFSVSQDPGTGDKPVPGKMNYSNLAVTLAESAAKTFFAWQDSFILDGKNGSDDEKSGKLELLGPNLKDVYFTINFSGLGIFKLGMERMETNSQDVKRVTAEMYCTRMTFEPGKLAVGC